MNPDTLARGGSSLCRDIREGRYDHVLDVIERTIAARSEKIEADRARQARLIDIMNDLSREDREALLESSIADIQGAVTRANRGC